MKYLLVLISPFLLLNQVTAQVNLDSLKSIWQDDALPDSSRFNAMYSFVYDGYLESQPDSALYYSEFMHEMAFQKGSRIYSGRALNLKGNYYWLKGYPDTALSLFEQSLNIAQVVGDQKGQADSHLGKGLIYGQKGNYYKSLDSYRTALKLYERIDEKLGQAFALNNIGIVYNQQGEIQKALEYYLRCYNLFEQTQAGSQMPIPLGNMGEAYMKLGDFAQATEFLEEAMIVGRKYGNIRSLAGNNLRFGRMLQKNGEYDKALPYFERSLKFAEEVDNKEYIANSHFGIGELRLEQGLLTAALKHCKIGLEISREMGLLRGQVLGCECLFKANKNAGETANALMYHEILVQLQDSMKRSETDKLLREIEYETRHLADSMAMVEKDLEREVAFQALMARKDRNTYISIGVGFIILLIAGGLWSRIRLVRRANARLQELKERAENSEQFEKRFLANMSHEIRTPMNAVLGMTNLTLDTGVNEKQEGYLNAIKRSSESLLVIINDILDLSKLEAGKMDINAEPFELRDLTKEIYESMRYRAEDKSLSFKVVVDENVPQFIVGDRARINQVLINLAGNAIKFTEKGRVEINVAHHRDPEECVEFRVKDTGIGIDEDKLEKLFLAFQQADSGTQKRYGGTGLGLSISKTLVKLLGGRIKVNSELGAGSEFSFRIPIVLASEEQIQSMEKEKTTDASELSGIRVLLAEDNEYNWIVVHDTLENLIPNVTLGHAENGTRALEELRKADYDMILMDANMPEMDGLEATREIRKKFKPPKKDIPIIALTASVLAADIESCYDAGMDAYIPKPFKREELINTMKKFYQPKIKDSKHEAFKSTDKKPENRSEAANGKVTDLSFLKDFCDGDEERMRKYVKLYLDSVPGNLEKINLSIANNEPEVLKRVVHSMKPQLNFMGMDKAKDLAETIEEKLSREPSIEVIQEYIVPLIRDCKISINELS